MVRTDDYFLDWIGFDIKKPVGISAETAHHHHFRTFSPVLHNFQDGLTAQAAAAANMSQE